MSSSTQRAKRFLTSKHQLPALPGWLLVLVLVSALFGAWPAMSFALHTTVLVLQWGVLLAFAAIVAFAAYLVLKSRKSSDDTK